MDSDTGNLEPENEAAHSRSLSTRLKELLTALGGLQKTPRRDSAAVHIAVAALTLGADAEVWASRER